MLLPTEAMVVAVGDACVRGSRMLSSMASFMHDVSMVGEVWSVEHQRNEGMSLSVQKHANSD